MLTLSSVRARITTGLVILAVPVVGGGVLASPAQAASYDCPQFQHGAKTALAICNVRSGQIRIRLRCRYYPDAASRWIGAGRNQRLDTSSCPFGVRDRWSGYIETRG